MARSPGKDRFRPEPVAAVHDPFSGQTPHRVFRKFAGQTDPVGLFHFVPGMRQARHEIPVVGKQDQSFTVLVEPARGNQTHVFRLRDQIHRLAGGMTVGQCADIAPGFVQHDIQFFRCRSDRLPVEFHPVAGPDPHRAAGRGRAVDFDPAGCDQRFRSPAGTDPRRAQEFRQTDLFAIHVRRRDQFWSAFFPDSSFFCSAAGAGAGVFLGGTSPTMTGSFSCACSGIL